MSEPSSEQAQLSNSIEPEIAAIGTVYQALAGLDAAAQRRVLEYVTKKLALNAVIAESLRPQIDEEATPVAAIRRDEVETPALDDEADGVNPVAQRWIKRSNLSIANLSAIFSIGGEEIDLVANKVPGESKKERMRSVLLLKAMASYLASGAARTGHKEAKEACEHYDAYDSANFAAYMKSFASEIGGSKESGYTLNARGLSSATELIRGMLAVKTG
jgi:hypothetical protein